ncbi:MAG: GntR family transcriptional regulator [Chloroflexi bacterium]|nr:GntR family transcriptional regulator [Chloroflexota bacterium]MDA1147491.1 GntR family transcriptional regulator [Chloroflexota bacterium]
MSPNPATNPAAKVTADLDAILDRFTLDRGSREPPYRQIARCVHDAVVRGELPAGIRLPAERDLARRLAVSRATVARALNELAATGLLERRVGHGTLVAFNRQSWHAGPTAGIPWGAILTALAPARLPTAAEFPRDAVPSDHSARRSRIAAALGVADRDADSIILTAGIPDATRFLVAALVRSGDRVIVETPASAALTISLAQRGAVALELRSSPTLAADLERLLDAQPAAVLVWLRTASRLREAGARAHLLGLTKRFALPVIEEPPRDRAATGLLAFEPHDHVIRIDDGWLSAPPPLARLLRPLATALGLAATPEG